MTFRELEVKEIFMKVIYPVLFYQEKNRSYSIFVPDLGKESNVTAATCGDTLEEAMYMSQDLIAGIILDEMETKYQVQVKLKI